MWKLLNWLPDSDDDWGGTGNVRDRKNEAGRPEPVVTAASRISITYKSLLVSFSYSSQPEGWALLSLQDVPEGKKRDSDNGLYLSGQLTVSIPGSCLK